FDFHFIRTEKPDDEMDDLKKALYNPEVICQGIVAYSAYENRLKAAIHEFAHAASSTDDGLVVDEYIDELGFDPEGMIVINKRHVHPDWDVDGDDKVQASELPADFVEYRENGSKTYFLTDKYRQKPDEWKSFVPARTHAKVSCTMDRSYDTYEFDKLIEHFLSQRLDAKINSR
ncbi:hypothetical protein MJD09_13480, partial [bacterium]|nr:hypothetical protein [bacterium]